MKNHTWMIGGILACLMWTPTLSAQTQVQGFRRQSAGVRPASYCSSCNAGMPAYAAPIYEGMDAGPCDSCGIPACGPCGGCGSLVRELCCDVKALVDVSVGRVLRCLLPCGVVCPPCGGCAAPACEPMACSSCGGQIMDMNAPMPMMEPIPAPAADGQPDPFRDDPVSTSRLMPRSMQRGYYPSAATRSSSAGARQASYSIDNPPSQLDRYRPSHVPQLRRASAYSAAPSQNYR